MTTPTALAVTGLATYRLTKLVIDDEITRGPRERANAALARRGTPLAMKAAYLLSCPWCVSVWAAGGLVTVRAVSPRAADVLELVLASSAVTGILTQRV